MKEVYFKLNSIIESFLNGDIGGTHFERAYSACYDFEELSEDENTSYFENVRSLLEYFSSCESDLDDYPDYYVNEAKLKKLVYQLKLEIE